jgi:type II secretory pathway pseudopilin PulG
MEYVALNWIELLTGALVVANVALVLVTAFYAWATYRILRANENVVAVMSQQLNEMKSQLKQTSTHNLTSLSNQLNWDLFKHREHLPPVLPSWVGLTDRQWAWRVLLLNHLNLLQEARLDYSRGFINDHELEEGWVLKARHWFRTVWTESTNQEIREGREVLRQLLRPEEGYPREFRQWLVQSHIIPPDLISD